jgi:hypothetical protein
MKTAVEQFWQDVQDILPSSVDTETGIKLVRGFEQAKEMEKEQIVKAHFDGCEIGEIFAYENREFITDSEQYYSKTFKQ